MSPPNSPFGTGSTKSAGNFATRAIPAGPCEINDPLFVWAQHWRGPCDEDSADGGLPQGSPPRAVPLNIGTRTLACQSMGLRELALFDLEQIGRKLLRQLRSYVGKGAGQQMLEVLIEEAEAGLVKVKRKLIQ